MRVRGDVGSPGQKVRKSGTVGDRVRKGKCGKSVVETPRGGDKSEEVGGRGPKGVLSKRGDGGHAAPVQQLERR